MGQDGRCIQRWENTILIILIRSTITHTIKIGLHTGLKVQGPDFSVKMLSYQYWKSHCGDKTVVRSSHLHNGISYTGKMTSLYWIRVQLSTAILSLFHHGPSWTPNIVLLFFVSMVTEAKEAGAAVGTAAAVVTQSRQRLECCQWGTQLLPEATRITTNQQPATCC